MVRRLTPAEVRAVAELRATSFGTEPASAEAIDAAAAILARHVGLGDFICIVAEDAGRIVSYGVGMIHQRLPADHNPTGRSGYIQSMETHPEHRRRGHARAVLAALLDWYREQDLPAVNLVASDVAEGFYRAAGFVDTPVGVPLARFTAR